MRGRAVSLLWDGRQRTARPMVYTSDSRRVTAGTGADGEGLG
jgi:hypothetical protein